MGPDSQAFAAIGALADPVRKALYDYVVAQPDAVGREEAARGAQVPVHTARFHLDKLVEAGLLEVDSRRLSGRSGPGAGRPARVYRRTDADVAVSLPERRYPLVGAVLATAVERALVGAELSAALATSARDTGRAAGAAYDGAGDDLARVADLLGREGFEPTRVDDTLELRNCPFDALAKQHTALVCGVNRDYIGGVLDGLGCDACEARLDPGEQRCCVRVVQG
jgi:predicted ArsR family transcriptional regulator